MHVPCRRITKRRVIEHYLRGKNRDSIAIELHVDTGTVTNIIKEWKMTLLSVVKSSSCSGHLNALENLFQTNQALTKRNVFKPHLRHFQLYEQEKERSSASFKCRIVEVL
jgi:hypothetical protein